MDSQLQNAPLGISKLQDPCGRNYAAWQTLCFAASKGAEVKKGWLRNQCEKHLFLEKTKVIIAQARFRDVQTKRCRKQKRVQNLISWESEVQKNNFALHCIITSLHHFATPHTSLKAADTGDTTMRQCLFEILRYC